MEVDENERENLEEEVQNIASSRIKRLFELWHTIGIKNLHEARANDVKRHVEKLFDDMVSEEEKNFDRITKNIERYERERLEIRKDLKVIDYQNDDSLEEALSLVDLEFKLRIEVHQLREKKSQRLNLYKDIVKQEKSLCSLTGTTPVSIGITFERVPSQEQISLIEKNIEELTKLRREREDEFCGLRNQIIELLENLKVEPNTTFERKIICEDLGNITLSQKTLEGTKSLLERLYEEVDENKSRALAMIDRIQSISDKLKIPSDVKPNTNGFYSELDLTALKEKLGILEEKRLEHLPLFIKNSEEELCHLWERCYVEDDSKNAFYITLNAKVGNEEMLAHYEHNITLWKNHHSNNKIIFDKIDEWYKLWQDRLELETCSKDPSRLGNFRALREEEKRRNRVNKRLPKIVSEIENLVQQYKFENRKDFLVEGRPFSETNKFKQQNHDNEVKLEKERKKEERKQMMVQETIFGVQSRTPNKTRNMNPVKRLKNPVKSIKETAKTPPKTPRTTITRPTSTRSSAARTPKRKPLIELNETFVSGSDAGQTPIAAVNGNIFRNANIVSSTLKSEELRATVPREKSKRIFDNKSGSATTVQGRSRVLRSGKELPFLLC